MRMIYKYLILFLIILFLSCSNYRFVNRIEHAQKEKGISISYLEYKSDIMLTAIRRNRNIFSDIDNNSSFYILELYCPVSGEIFTRIWNDSLNLLYSASGKSDINYYTKEETILNDKEIKLCQYFEQSNMKQTSVLLNELESVLDGCGYTLTKIEGYNVQKVLR